MRSVQHDSNSSGDCDDDVHNSDNSSRWTDDNQNSDGTEDNHTNLTITAQHVSINHDNIASSENVVSGDNSVSTTQPAEPEQADTTDHDENIRELMKMTGLSIHIVRQMYNACNQNMAQTASALFDFVDEVTS